jgi:CRP/FNR family transcriptional regulator
VLDDFPLMEKRLLEFGSNQLVAAQEQMLLLGRKTARERLASFLLTQSRQGMPSGHSRQGFRLPMTRIDIADYLGLTIETVSRMFTRLCAERLIDIVSQSGLVIRDPAALEDLAGGMPSSPVRASARSNVADQHGALRLGARPWKSSARESRKEETCHTTF